MTESHELLSLLHLDPKQNLIAQHPSMILNAYQKVHSWLRVFPTESIVDPQLGGKVIEFYPAFSRSLPENNGLKIVGQFDAIKQFVDYIKAGARGDGAKFKTILFEGPAGTGKTAFADIIYALGRHFTTSDPQFNNYTFEWVNLKSIPGVAPIARLHRSPESGEIIEYPIPSATNSSPLVLLPDAFQKRAIENAWDAAVQIAGVKPDPVLEANPQDQWLMDQIAKHYADAAGKSSLSDEEFVAAMNKHIRVKRYVIGESGNFGRIDAQGRDIDWAGLFFSTNPMIMTQFGANHPFAYNLNGKVTTATPVLTVDDSSETK